eukprot:m.27694 g.27694  ORF g.27694 m.27694 type:complete len:253 (+) comp7922_c0_seq1:191-949(+)
MSVWAQAGVAEEQQRQLDERLKKQQLLLENKPIKEEIVHPPTVPSHSPTKEAQPEAEESKELLDQIDVKEKKKKKPSKRKAKTAPKLFAFDFFYGDFRSSEGADLPDDAQARRAAAVKWNSLDDAIKAGYILKEQERKDAAAVAVDMVVPHVDEIEAEIEEQFTPKKGKRKKPAGSDDKEGKTKGKSKSKKKRPTEATDSKKRTFEIQRWQPRTQLERKEYNFGVPCVKNGDIMFRIVPLKAIKIPGSERYR